MANALILSPLRFGLANYVLRVEHDGTPADVLVGVTPGRDYWVSGDAQADGADGDGDLLGVVAAALSAATGVTVTVTRTTAQRIQVSAASGALALLWDHVNTTLDKAVLGFSADTVAAASLIGDLQPQGIFRPDCPTGFGRDRPVVMAGLDRSLAGDVAGTFFGEGHPERRIRFGALADAKVRAEAAPVDEPHGTLDELWTGTLARARRFRLYEDEAALAHSVYRCSMLRDPCTQHPRHPFYWQAEIEAVRLAVWAPAAASARSLYHLDITGTNEAIETPDDAVLDTLTTGATWAGWVRMAAVEDNRSILGRNTLSWRIRTETALGGLGLLIFFGTTANYARADLGLDDLATHHFAITFDAGTVAMYVDGVPVPVSVVGTIPSALAADTVGVTCGHPTISPQCRFADMAVWARALPPSEIATIAVSQVDLTSHAPLLWWGPSSGDGSGGITNLGSAGAALDAATTNIADVDVIAGAMP